VKVLVTGATGFLGTHLVRELEARGHHVVPFARSLGGDVLDPTRVARAAAGCEGVFHCAGKVSRRPEDAEELYRVHVEGTRVVLDACASAGVRRAVVASTSGTVAVSDVEHVARESDAPPIGILARWPYYRSKLFAEREALERNREGFAVVSINPSLLLGPGDVHGSSTEDVRLLLEGAVPAVPAGGLSFVDVRDAADAMVKAMDLGRAGERYLVGGCNLTVADFFARLSRIASVRAPWLVLPRSRQVATLGARLVERVAARVGVPSRVDAVSVEMAQCFWYVDSSKAERELSWSSRDPSVTLHDTVVDLRERGVVWPLDAATDPRGRARQAPSL
jgi:dihydroflavonol-4-reductase